MKKRISFVIPAYNEAENIPELTRQVCQEMNALDYEFELIFVNDGSTDNTMEVLQTLAETNPKVFFIDFSRNFGHQPALKAGLDHSKGDAVISMDADLQHPPSMIKELIAKWEEGFDIVYTKRMEDPNLPWSKRFTSNLFYHIINHMSQLDLEAGTADFRLMDRKCVDAFCRFSEHDLFIRGLIKWMGFKQFGIDYMPNERFRGTTKYSIKKMIQFAVRGITSFSVYPLEIATYIGLFFAIIAMLSAPFVIHDYYCGNTVSGWPTVMIAIVFFGGLNLFILGILGVYLGKLFLQAKERPLYIIKQTNYGKQ